MKYTPELLGWKLYGLSEFSKVGLFNRPFVIVAQTNQKQIVSKLKESGFKNNSNMAIRFSKDNSMNLPFFVGKFKLVEVADIIQRERKDYVPFVHGLVSTKFCAGLYFDGMIIILEVWPGIGRSKKGMFNENADFIKIEGNRISIARYKKLRSVDNIKGKTVSEKPFAKATLIRIAKRIISLKKQLRRALKIQNPLLCDLNFENIFDVNFMGIQKTSNFDIDMINNSMHEYYVVKSLSDLEKYDGKKDLFLDISLGRDDAEFIEIVSTIKNFPRVYVKSLTMHLSVVLREFGATVEKGFINEDYEIIEFST